MTNYGGPAYDLDTDVFTIQARNQIPEREQILILGNGMPPSSSLGNVTPPLANNRSAPQWTSHHLSAICHSPHTMVAFTKTVNVDAYEQDGKPDSFIDVINQIVASYHSSIQSTPTKVMRSSWT